MFSSTISNPFVPAKILVRGLAYFNERAVERLEETTKYQWEAVVSGSEDYEVAITVSKEVKSWSCDCPYDGGTSLQTRRSRAVRPARSGAGKSQKR
ncbi:MAG: hypothetical protein H6559_22285 [Lewinellaceae bacterium]|nr:hypothetical protein [Lewinellaceae bacterium]